MNIKEIPQPPKEQPGHIPPELPIPPTPLEPDLPGPFEPEPIHRPERP